MIKRKPVVAGMFYQDTFDKLDKQIKLCFESKLGPGELPGKRKNKRIFGGIAPHAGYSYSGPCASWLYKEIGESKLPDCYIIIGPNHSGIGPDFSTYLFSDWETPFGDIKVDTNLGHQLAKKFPQLANESSAHTHEHSVEVQLPLLQFANRDNIDKLRFIPLVVKSQNYTELCRLGEAISRLDREICIIASSDFTHYGSNYGFVPFLHAIKDNIHLLDSGALEAIKRFNSKKLFNLSKKTTICGIAPIVTAVEAVKRLGSKKANVLDYYTSGELANDYKNSVSYASVSFE